nr:hypothetical protein 13 [Desulfobacterales bacterium]
MRIGAVVEVEKTEIDLEEVHARFTRPNPKFAENERLGFSNLGVPQELSLYSERGTRIHFPRGLVRDAASLGSDAAFQDETVSNPLHFDQSKIICRPYQIPALDAMLQRNQGILEAPPGSGKTVIAIEAIVRRSQKTLVLVHTKDLLNQWCDRLRQFANIVAGVIDADRFDIQDVTVAMVQSLRKPLDPSFVRKWGCVVLDECHHAPAYTFQRLINQFPARFRYGLTATPERRDGLTFVLHAVFGSTIHRISQDGLFAAGEIMKPTIRAIETSFYNPLVTDYRDLTECVVRDTPRNDLILSHVAREAEAGHSCLVLSNRIDHTSSLHKHFTGLCPGIPADYLTSRINKVMRTKITDQMRKGEISVLFATQLADEGLDMRRLDRLFLTCPIRSKNRVSQQIGRILRTFPGKTDAIVYDFRDSLCSLAESQYQTRLRCVYQANDYTVEEASLES